MTETVHTRSRRAALGGLVVQSLAFVATIVLGTATRSYAVTHLSWLLLAGVPVWLAVLLAFRQRELAALEALDLEVLRRERESSGAGAALFDEQGGSGLGYRVAEARLQWMHRVLVPIFGGLTGVYLLGMGLYLWQKLVALDFGEAVSSTVETMSRNTWPTLANVPITLVMLAVLMLGLFLLSRYASGMSRVKDWQLLRGCGSYMLGGTIVTLAVFIGLLLANSGHMTTIHVMAWAVPALMVVLGIETLANLILDFYRPRADATEARAAFDSRLLGLIAEPGGIASSIADAINYQFGFQVSQTWFYRLLGRATVPLLFAGGLAIWAMTSIVIVKPQEHVIVERFGRQLNVEAPYGPGLHFKLPYPFDIARVYETGQLHQIHVGYQQYDADVKYTKEGSNELTDAVILWTQPTHYGLQHFDFLLSPPPDPNESERLMTPRSQPTTGAAQIARDLEVGSPEETQRASVHLIRTDVVIQYRIDPTRLEAYTQIATDPRRFIRDLAWEGVTTFLAGLTVDKLLGEELEPAGRLLRERLNKRTHEFGVDVVYVGITNVHPETSVAEAYRNVVAAEMERVAAVRGAQVAENQSLAQVAGDARLARDLAYYVQQADQARSTLVQTSEQLADVSETQVADLAARLRTHADAFKAVILAQARVERATEQQLLVDREYDLGMSRTLQERDNAAAAVSQAQQDLQAAQTQLDAALADVLPALQQALGGEGGAARVAALLDRVRAQVAEQVWNGVLDERFTLQSLGGEAAVVLSAAFAERWTIELDAAAKLAQARNERAAYQAAPHVYRTRRTIEVLVAGLKDARKFFLAFDPGDRTVRTRFVIEDQLINDIFSLRPDQNSR